MAAEEPTEIDPPRLTERLELRMTAEQLKHLQRQAQDAGVSVSKYIRRRLFPARGRRAEG